MREFSFIRINFNNSRYAVFIRRGYQMPAIQRASVTMSAYPPPQSCNPDPGHRRIQLSAATLEAALQRKIATGWLYLADMTSDDNLRASYERLARRHFQCADAEQAGLGPVTR
jgi:hypothetical protein